MIFIVFLLIFTVFSRKFKEFQKKRKEEKENTLFILVLLWFNVKFNLCFYFDSFEILFNLIYFNMFGKLLLSHNKILNDINSDNIGYVKNRLLTV